MHPVLAFVLDLGQIAVMALLIIWLTRSFLILPFIVKGASMEPNFHENEYLIVDEVSYHFRSPQRGEIVVFRPPELERQFYIKRVIALPGERVEVRDNRVTVFNADYPNGFVLDETYLPAHLAAGPDDYTVLGAHEYYMLGDNRGESLDSRTIGAIPEENIVGRVWLRGLPIEKAGAIFAPSYGSLVRH